MKHLIWFRQDLRVYDNTALHHACKNTNDEVVAVYYICPKQWQAHDIAACQVNFILRNLALLSKELSKLNIPLLLFTLDTFEQVTDHIIKLLNHHKFDELFYNEEYAINELHRDNAIAKLCHKYHIKVNAFCDQLLIPPGDIKTKKNGYYTVFTPFKNNWLNKIKTYPWHVFPIPKSRHSKFKIALTNVPTAIANFEPTIDPQLWPAGENEPHQRLNQFIENAVYAYHKHRDIPFLHGTSTLSPYLALGLISSRQCLHAVLSINAGEYDNGNKGVITWINELIWREFYKHILYLFPHICMGQPFKKDMDQIQWVNDKKQFHAWQIGNTGYPLVDAGMRQLNQIGWMHNRLRMITAMFLTKHLLIDWRWGEKYFMQNLIDGDFSANNGGWQWCASTGNDPVPYFRIFNPHLQAKKYDSKGEFIHSYIPELSTTTKNNKNLSSYPNPIIEHNFARKRALDIFAKTNQRRSSGNNI